LLKIDPKFKRIVKIGDFGLVALHKNFHPLENSIQNEIVEQSHTTDIGTIKYAASEVLDGTKYDTKADIYSLGVVLRKIFNLVYVFKVL